jgi:hypothetical protein
MLIPTGADTYFYEDEDGLRVPVEFLRQTDRAVAEHLFVGGNAYRRVASDPAFRPDESMWLRFAGAYEDPSNRSEGAVWRVTVEGSQLHLSGDWADDDCTPVGPGAFLSDIGLLQFDGDGTVLQVACATRYFKRAGP